ncbi:hypothetical protein [Actinokineospora sp.]|uniref:hypothetical protein n=1 Tax=Actinokineospora sp. TaxID=1872133 RepID=UPI003D6C6DF2
MFIVVIVVVLGSMNIITLLLPRTFLKQRQNFKNGERGQLAASQGWQFAPYAPELLNQWGRISPFTLQGDRRVAFGVIRGTLNGLAFTAFDYQRRVRVTVRGSIIYSDENKVETVWAVRLPATMSYVEVARRALFMNPDQGQIPIAYRDLNRGYLVQGQNPQLVAELLTPQVVDFIIDAKLEGWTIVGADLVYHEENGFTRNTTQEIMQKLEQLRYLVSLFPQHVWQKYGTPAPPMLSAQQPKMPAQPQFAQPYQGQPSGGYAQPQQGYPMGQQQYPPQAYPQQQFPPRY